MSESPILPHEQTVSIVGVGLIGGSLAAALKQRRRVARVIGVGRDLGRLQQAQAIGLLDEVSTDLVAAARVSDVIVFCTPVELVASGVRVAESHIRPQALMTDAGSVKQPICDQLVDLPAFIGAHPIAGSHRQGFEAANPDLFQGRVCVVTPTSRHVENRIERLEQFWRGVGMRTVRMTPDGHDLALAMTSHMPHVVASALAGTLAEENRMLVGTGFRDTSRIAAGDPELWRGILLQNAEHVIEGIDAIQLRLQAFRAALASKDDSSLKVLLARGQESRISLDLPADAAREDR